MNTECVITCPKEYYVNELTNQCLRGEVELFSFSFLFLFSSLLIGTLLILTSCLITKGRNQGTDIMYAVTSLVEFVNRLCLLGNLFIKS
jgi:hypothetical protein